MHGHIFGHSAQELTVYQMGGDMKLEILAADVAEQSKEDTLYASAENSRYEEDDLVAGRAERAHLNRSFLLDLENLISKTAP